MSGFVFRLFEDLNVQEGDPGRFKLEIMVNRGATIDREIIAEVQNHTVPILHENFVDINKKLTFAQLETFFKHLLTMQESTLNSPEHNKKSTKAQTSEEEAKKNNEEAAQSEGAEAAKETPLVMKRME